MIYHNNESYNSKTSNPQICKKQRYRGTITCRKLPQLKTIKFVIKLFDAKLVIT